MKLLKWSGLALASLIMITVLSNCGNVPAVSTQTPTPTTTTTTWATTITTILPLANETPIRDGKFEFSVIGVKYPGDIYRGQTALGTWLILTTSVVNISNDPKEWTGASYFRWNDLRFSPEWMVPRRTTVNPGVSFESELWFDVSIEFASESRLVDFRWKDSGWSIGTESRLRTPAITRSTKVGTADSMNTKTAVPNTTTPVSSLEMDGSEKSRLVPVDQVGHLPNWDIKVLDVVHDAGTEIANANLFNPDAKPGHQFYLTKVQVTYTGSGESYPLWLDLTFKVVGRSQKSYGDGYFSCGVVPDELINQPSKLFTGGTVIGNLCWEVEERDVNSLVLSVNESGGFLTLETIWMELPSQT